MYTRYCDLVSFFVILQVFGISGRTHHSHWPEDEIIDNKPSLFREPNRRLSLANTHPLGVGNKNIVHDASAKTHENGKRKRDEFEVIQARVVEPRLGVMIGKGEELRSRRSESREDDMCEEEEQDAVDGEACRMISTGLRLLGCRKRKTHQAGVAVSSSAGGR